MNLLDFRSSSPFPDHVAAPLLYLENVSYENLADPDKVIRLLQRFTGIEFTCGYEFARRCPGEDFRQRGHGKVR